MDSLNMASSLPLPLSAGLFTGDAGFESQLKRATDQAALARSAVGKKSRATKGIKKGSKAQNPELHASLDAARTMPAPDEPGAPPMGPELAWASSPNPGVPEKFARGKSNRLYL